MNALTNEQMLIAHRILAERIKAKLTPRQLDREAGLPTFTVAQIENGTRPATPAEVAALAGAFGMAPAGLGAAA